MLRPRIGLAVLANRYEVGADQAPALRDRLRSALGQRAVALEVADAVVDDNRTAAEAGRRLAEAQVDAVCLAAATWCDDDFALDLLAHCDRPAITWAIPGIETGSLCGTQQLDCVLRQVGRPYRFVYGDPEDSQACERAEAYARAAALDRALRRARFGLIGRRARGMTEIACDEFALARVIGPRLLSCDTQQYLALQRAAPEDEARAVWERVTAAVGRVSSSAEDGLTSARGYLAIKRFVEDNDLAGVAVGCYPDLMGQVCLAASLLAEEGVVVGCEGDVNGTVAMFMLQSLSGQPVHNTDLLFDYAEDNSLLFSHCGSGGFSLARDSAEIHLSPVRLAERGVCVLFPSRPGPVTLLNLVGAGERYQAAVMEGEAVESEMVFPGNPLRVRFQRPVRTLLDEIAARGIGHHWMAGYGLVGGVIRDYCDLVGLTCHTL